MTNLRAFQGHFMVMKKNGGWKPRHLHLKREDAEAEAIRLSEASNGSTFLVMQIVGRVKAV